MHAGSLRIFLHRVLAKGLLNIFCHHGFNIVADTPLFVLIFTVAGYDIGTKPNNVSDILPLITVVLWASVSVATSGLVKVMPAFDIICCT
jgi:hypothetical protein